MSRLLGVVLVLLILAGCLYMLASTEDVTVRDVTAQESTIYPLEHMEVLETSRSGVWRFFDPETNEFCYVYLGYGISCTGD